MSSMPASLKAATGVDALTHAIEGYITKGAWELTDMLHLKAIEVIGRSLRASVQGEAQGAEGMALGQYIAGMGFSNVGLGLVHGMAHPLGAFYGTPHGVANAVLLPHIMAYNAEYTGEKYRDIAVALGNKQASTLPIAEARQAAIEAVAQLNRDVNIPARLRDVGMKEEDIDALAAAALADVCTGGNPRDTNLEEIKALYRAIF
jgi:lactaldehyde reductase